MNAPAATNALMLHLEEFKYHVLAHLHKGTDCDGRERQYVRHSTLVNYWNPDQFADFIQCFRPEQAHLILRRKIRDRYLRVFSTLAFASAANPDVVQELMLLVNNKVSDDRLPSGEPENYLSPDAWRLFDEHQWTFFPIDLASTDKDWLRLDRRRTFPGLHRTSESLGRLERPRPGPHDARFRFIQLEKEVNSFQSAVKLVRHSRHPLFQG